MNKRKYRSIFRRIQHLPMGKSFFKYLNNTFLYYYNSKTRSLTLPYPDSIMLEVTNHCQLSCLTCAREYSFGKTMDKGNMDLNKAKELLKHINIYLNKIGLTGLGEPLIYPHLEELLDYINDLNPGISTFISSNCQLPNTVDILKRLSYKFDTLQISIDGIGSVFEEIRQNSKFSLFENNISHIAGLLKKNSFIPKLNMVVFDKNYFQMKEVLYFAKNYNISEVYFNSFNLVSNNLPLEIYNFYNTERFKNALIETISLAQELNIKIFYPKFDAEKGFNHCPYPWGNFYISFDGYIVPCCAKPFPKEKNFGNVFDNAIIECINSEEFINFRKLAKENITPEFCNRCHYIF